MKKYLLTLFLILALTPAAWAAGAQYVMRVDGLACPYCAYGVEKKFKAIDGVKKIDVNLDKGIVTVDVADGVEFTDEQMKKLFEDSGFTFRSMTRKDLE